MFKVQRDEHHSGYTCISNRILHDRRLSLKARGLLMVVLSLPETWEFSVRGIGVLCSMSDESVSRCIKELCELGYAVVRGAEGKRSGKDYFFFETPDAPEKTVPEKAVPEKAVPQNTVPEKAVPQNTAQLNNNTDINNKSNINKKKEKIAEYQAVIDLFNSVCVSLPGVIELDPQRYHLIEQASRSVKDFGELFSQIERSDFLTGRNGKWQGCSFDWLMKPENLIKLQKGKYDNRSASPPPVTRDYSKALSSSQEAADGEFLF